MKHRLLLKMNFIKNNKNKNNFRLFFLTYFKIHFLYLLRCENNNLFIIVTNSLYTIHYIIFKSIRIIQY